MASTGLFTLKFPVSVGYDMSATGVTRTDLGNITRNLKRGQILILVPTECSGKNCDGMEWQMAHTAITTETVTAGENGLYSVTVKNNMVVYLPAQFNKTVEGCRSLAEVKAAVNAVGEKFQLSGKWDFLDYSATQDRGNKPEWFLRTNPRRVALTASEISRIKAAK